MIKYLVSECMRPMSAVGQLAGLVVMSSLPPLLPLMQAGRDSASCLAIADMMAVHQGGCIKSGQGITESSSHPPLSATSPSPDTMQERYDYFHGPVIELDALARDGPWK